VVLVVAPFLFVEIVENGNQLWMLEALVTQQLAYVRPVLLLSVGIVVLSVGPARPGCNRPPDHAELGRSP
jgi:hypothetical protein